jgi:hypothetical protein
VGGRAVVVRKITVGGSGAGGVSDTVREGEGIYTRRLCLARRHVIEPASLLIGCAPPHILRVIEGWSGRSPCIVK